jgi:DNA-directed RNA polymerase specialized sigma24 family protein
MKRNSIGDMCGQNDFQRLFEDSASQLHWLCYTLTGDEELTSRVFEAALEQSLKGADGVFREWMLSWARRLTIKVCITLVRPAAVKIVQRPYFSQLMPSGLVSSSDLDDLLSQPSELLQQQVLQLDNLQRFVFVLRALEGYSRRDTALLLELDDRSCEWAFSQATWALQAAAGRAKSLGSDIEFVDAPPCTFENSIKTQEQDWVVTA